MTEKVRLTLAVADYDHVADVVNGRVPVEGVTLTCLNLSGLEIFHRFIRYREWDVSEMSLAKYVSMRSQEQNDLTAIPVFPNRMFRHSCIWVRRDGPTEPSELVGRNVGVTEWAQTAGVWCRGILADEFGLQLRDVHWFQASAYEPGRAEKVALALPEGVVLTHVNDATLQDMLLRGDLDAVISSEPPRAFLRGDGSIRRLFGNPMDLERQYFERTSIYPIMHVLCVKREVVDGHPWVAMNLLEAFQEAARRSVARVSSWRRSCVPLPWTGYHAEWMARHFDEGRYWVCDIDHNRHVLDVFLRYAREQGVAHREVSVDELFPVEVRTQVVV